MKAKKIKPKHKSSILVWNKKARRNYSLLETFEAGIVLSGSEIKSLRAGQVSLADAYGRIIKNELWLVNCHIAQYSKDANLEYDPRRSRKLLIKKTQLHSLQGKLQKGLTLIPIKIYLKRGIAKVELALARGKKLWDKRQVLKERDIKRQIQRELKQRI